MNSFFNNKNKILITLKLSSWAKRVSVAFNEANVTDGTEADTDRLPRRLKVWS